MVDYLAVGGCKTGSLFRKSFSAFGAAISKYQIIDLVVPNFAFVGGNAFSALNASESAFDKVIHSVGTSFTIDARNTLFLATDG